MKTKLLSEKDLVLASKIIKSGGIVAFPTETVYGLGANGLNGEAVKKIFIAKGRPQDNPLILHISSIDQLEKLVVNIPKKAELLIKKFWPGPLTIIFKKSAIVPFEVTCGLDSVGIRMPSNPLALKLIELSACPIAAPSANISGSPSPTEVNHVIFDLNGRIDAIVDGGKTNIGIESTIIDLSTSNPVILRPGMISTKQIESVIGRVKNHIIKNGKLIKPKAPGMKYTHYSPNAKIIFFDCDTYEKKIKNYYKDKISDCVVLKVNKASVYSVKSVYIGDNPKVIAKNLFSTFRKIDSENFKYILVEKFEKSDSWMGVRNRLSKASTKIIK